MTASPVQTGFDRLAPPLQRWLWEQGWSGLREAQAAALPLLLDGENDVVIAAATASGKTEAAFLPLLTRLWQGGGKGKRRLGAVEWGGRRCATMEGECFARIDMTDCRVRANALPLQS